MLSQWMLVALVAAAPLVVAIAILIGARLPNGTITITSGAAVIAFTIFFAFLGGGAGLSGDTAPNSPLNPLVWIIGMILLLAAWTLAFADAVQARRWRWAAPLTVATYLSFCALLSLAVRPDPCLFVPPQGFGAGGAQCAAPNQSLQLIVLIGCYIGPLTAHLYSLRDTLPHATAQASDLTVSPLHAEER